MAALAEPLLALPAAPEVAMELFTRCWVSMGPDTGRFKVWFDNCSSSSGSTQRAWINCPVHGCIKYINVLDTRSRTCSALWLWRQRADIYDLSRAEHLEYWPDDSSVDGSMDLTVLEEF